MRIRRWRASTFASLSLTLLAALPVEAARLVVSPLGSDSDSCGPAKVPCATIARAVTNAVDRDSIAVAPGSYGGATISKALTLFAQKGTGTVVIRGNISLAANGAVLGKPRKGFQFVASAVTISADAVTVRGNGFNRSNGSGDPQIRVVSGTGAIIRDNRFHEGGIGVEVLAATEAQIRANRFDFFTVGSVILGSASSSVLVRDNTVSGPGNAAFTLGGADHLVMRNVVTIPGNVAFLSGDSPSGIELRENVVLGLSAPGYYLQNGTGWRLVRNAAIGGGSIGFLLTAPSAFLLNDNAAVGNTGQGYILTVDNAGSPNLLKGNSAIRNGDVGLLLASSGETLVTGGQIYGNAATMDNCGLRNTGSGEVSTNGIFWGAATGPGAAPANLACKDGGGTVPVTPWAIRPAALRIPPIR